MSIQKRLLGLLKSDEVRALATVGIDGISVKYPMIALFMSAVHEAAGLADEMRIDLLEKETIEESRFLLNYRFDSMSPMHLFSSDRVNSGISLSSRDTLQ